ncbi:MAG: sugar ABC transporter permease [Deinococcus sp.]|nr:sugar ABC transporter permease [Deinococcus sp.]
MRLGRLIEATNAFLFLLPFLLFLAVFVGYGVVRTVYFSLTDYNLFDPPKWVGFQNYVRLFREPDFIRALQHSLAFTLVVTVVQTLFSLLLATVLNQRIRGITFFRTVYYLPSVLSSAAITLIFLWLYQKTGFLNFAVSWVLTYLPLLLTFVGLFVVVQAVQVVFERSRGLPAKPFDLALATASLLLAAAGTFALDLFGVVNPREGVQFKFIWLNTRQEWAGLPIPLWAIVLQNIYTTIPTLMLIYLAGLQDIPKSLYEAASLDGADDWQQFTRITVPMLRPVTFLVITLGLIGTLQVFDQVALISGPGGAPLESTVTLAYYVYNNVFPSGATPKVGLASAAAITLSVLTLVVVLLQRRFGVSERGY